MCWPGKSTLWCGREVTVCRSLHMIHHRHPCRLVSRWSAVVLRLDSATVEQQLVLERLQSLQTDFHLLVLATVALPQRRTDGNSIYRRTITTASGAVVVGVNCPVKTMAARQSVSRRLNRVLLGAGVC